MMTVSRATRKMERLRAMNATSIRNGSGVRLLGPLSSTDEVDVAVGPSLSSFSSMLGSFHGTGAVWIVLEESFCVPLACSGCGVTAGASVGPESRADISTMMVSAQVGGVEVTLFCYALVACERLAYL